MQILDFATGYLMAFGLQAALWRQARQGGSWLVEVSLAETGHWLRSLGRLDKGFQVAKPDWKQYQTEALCGFGPGGQSTLRHIGHAARFQRTPAGCARPSMPPGSHAPVWPAA